MTKIINWVIIKLLLTSGVKTVLASNNSPLLKDSQKTKGTIWKPLIAVSSLSIFSFISGQYLPYVIMAVSGSGAIAAVPLAVFAVSTVVALISTIYLIRLAVSRADSKKEAGLDGEEFGHTLSQEPQKFVCENCINLENKSNVPAPQSPPVTLGTKLNPSVSAPPPPPPFGASPPPPPPPPPPTTPTDPLEALKKRKRDKTSGSAGTSNGGPVTNLGDLAREAVKMKEKLSTDKNETPEARAIRMEKEIEERRKNKKDVEQSDALNATLKKIKEAKEYSDSESGRSDHDDTDDWSDGESKKSKGKKLIKHRKKSTPSNPQSFDKPPIPPKPAGLQTKPEAPPASQVNEMQDPSILSVKERRERFGQKV